MTSLMLLTLAPDGDGCRMCAPGSSNMRTTIDLPEPLLDEVQAVTRASTRREALVIALEDYLRRQKLRAVISAAGDLDLELDVRALREADRRRSRG